MLYWFMKGVLTPLLRGLYRVRVEGRALVPRHGPVILAANHRSFLDSLFLPLVPVGLVGTEECQPVDRKLPRLFRRVHVRFGTPISADRYVDDVEGLALRQITDEVMFEIVQLCGCYEYRDTYATKRAEDLPT